MTPILRKFYKRSFPNFAFQLLQFRISSVTLQLPLNASEQVELYPKKWTTKSCEYGIRKRKLVIYKGTLLAMHHAN